MDKVVIIRAYLNIYSMQVCAVKNATDKEILEVCNRENPSGTSAGWATVIRKRHLPVQCKDYSDRLHFIVLC